jgi:hypothetical protein
MAAKLESYQALFLTEKNILTCPCCSNIDCEKTITNPFVSYLHFKDIFVSISLLELEIYLNCENCGKNSILRIDEQKGNLVLTHTKEPGQP